MKGKKFKDLFILISFAAILFLPILDSFFVLSPVKEIFENRQSIEAPKKPESYFELKNYFKNFESFFNDNYGFRKTLISWHNKILDKIFNESPLSRVIEGSENWLFFDNQNSVLDVQGKAEISDELIDKIVAATIKNYQQAKENNIDYLLVIAADKTSIYPEFLPTYIKVSEDHRIDKFLSKLKKTNPNFPILDLRKILLEAKKHETVYHQTDTHWNRRGAFYAYQEIMNSLNKQNFNQKALTRNKFKEVEKNDFIGDISQMVGSSQKNIDYDLAANFAENLVFISASDEEKNIFYKPIIVKNYNQNLPRLFVYKDSFFGNLINFVSYHFSYSIYSNQQPCNLDFALIKKYRPNVLIQQFWEARIEEIAKKCQSNLN